jgi:hypothetical protein
MAAVAALVIWGLVQDERPQPATAADKAPVGQVASLGGNKRLYLAGANNSKKALAVGDVLRFGDTVLAAAGVQARLTLTKPERVAGDPELVYVKPLDGAEISVKMQRVAALTVEADISG